MTQNQQAARKHGKLSRWLQHKGNARVNRKIRGGKGRQMGMDLLILNTVGRRSGQPRATPVAWFTDDDDNRLIVASGGVDLHPDWHANLMAHPEKATIELPGQDPLPVTPHVLEGADRERAWQRVIAVNPRLGKYQNKSARVYPVIRLLPR